MARQRKPRIPKVCKCCGKHFEVVPSLAKRCVYCSLECKRKCAKRTAPYTKKTCPTCKKAFQVHPHENKRVYCSRNCANKAKRKPRITKTCPVCQSCFSPPPSKPDQIHCSRKCFHLGIARKSRACPTCGIVYVPKKHSDQKFCSPKCQAKARRNRITITCAVCDKKFRVIASKEGRAQYCSQQCQFQDMSTSHAEQQVIDLFARLLNQEPSRQHSFPWFRSKHKNGLMRVDAYFPDHHLVVEYDGKHHYQYMPHFHSSLDAFHRAQQRDRHRDQLLRQHNIQVIRFAYNEPKTLKHAKERLKSVGINYL